jgi:hypothetical protein
MRRRAGKDAEVKRWNVIDWEGKLILLADNYHSLSGKQLQIVTNRPIAPNWGMPLGRRVRAAERPPADWWQNRPLAVDR